MSIFSDPKIIQLLQTKFVSLAVDAWYFNRKQDPEGEFYRKVVSQDPSRIDFNRSSQGRYAFTPEGQLLGFNNNRSVERIQTLLQRALEKYPPAEASPSAPAASVGAPLIEGTKKQPYFDRTLKDGTVVVNVYAKVLGGQDEGVNEHANWFQASLGEDHLWIKKDEAESLVRGDLPESLKRRIVLYHLNDFTRGEPNLWRPDQVKKSEIVLREGRLTGSVALETADAKRGFEADFLGFVESKDGKLIRFDGVARGTFWGAGSFTNTAGTPKGRFPLAVAFRMADGKSEADKVPPQGARDLNEYLR